MNTTLIITPDRTEAKTAQMPFVDMLENRRFALLMLAGFAGFTAFCQYASAASPSVNVHFACGAIIGFVQSLI